MCSNDNMISVIDWKFRVSIKKYTSVSVLIVRASPGDKYYIITLIVLFVADTLQVLRLKAEQSFGYTVTVGFQYVRQHPIYQIYISRWNISLRCFRCPSFSL